MENKEIRNLLVENIKSELRDFAQIQRELKKSRKLEFRPKDKSLSSICDEITNNRFKISLLFYYYRWLKHSLKYWTKRDVHDFWDYQHSNISNNPNAGYSDTCRYQSTWWNKNKNYEDYVKNQFKNYIVDLIKKYKIELSNEQIDELIKYLYKNI